MTIYTETGLTVHVAPSLFAGAYVFTEFALTDDLLGYTHQIDAYGGYISAQITLTADMGEAENWLENGLMRHIVVYDSAMQIIWAGFVNAIGISLNGLQVRRGPALGITNRVIINYSPLDISVSPPVSGSSTNTAYVDDAESQAKYGILEDRISGGNITTANALDLRDYYLAEHKDPETAQSFDTEGAGAISVALECAGYIEYLDRYTFSAASLVSQSVTAKILAVLAANPNISIFSTDYTKIETNAMLVPVADFKEQTAKEVIKGLVALGDAASNRSVFGLYANQRFAYNVIPTTFDYVARISTREVSLYGGNFVVQPWNILPGRWLFYDDLLTGMGTITGIPTKSDPRVQFIENVVYTAPFGINMAGGKTGRLSQKIAKLGVSGTWS